MVTEYRWPRYIGGVADGETVPAMAWESRASVWVVPVPRDVTPSMLSVEDAAAGPREIERDHYRSDQIRMQGSPRRLAVMVQIDMSQEQAAAQVWGEMLDASLAMPEVPDFPPRDAD